MQFLLCCSNHEALADSPLARRGAASPGLTASLPGSAGPGSRLALAGLSLPLPHVPELLVPALRTQTVTTQITHVTRNYERGYRTLWSPTAEKACCSHHVTPRWAQGCNEGKVIYTGKLAPGFLVASVNYASDTRHNGFSTRGVHLQNNKI